MSNQLSLILRAGVKLKKSSFVLEYKMNSRLSEESAGKKVNVNETSRR